MFDHKAFATLGLHPDAFSHQTVAVLGQYSVEITITPVQSSGGGAPFNLKPNKYRIQIKITNKSKVWEFETETNERVAKVAAKLSKVLLSEPKITITSVTKDNQC